MQYVLPYSRASTDRQEASPKAQVDAIKLWFSTQTLDGYTLHEPFVDAAVSSRVPFEDRPYGSLLMQRAREGDIIVAAKFDRMFRNVREALNTIHVFEQRGIRLVCVDRQLDTKTAMGRFVLNVMASVAQMEREQISERTKSALDWRKERGLAASGRPPIGWVPKRTRVSGMECSIYVPDPKTRFPALLAEYLIDTIGLSRWCTARCLHHLDLLNSPHPTLIPRYYEYAKCGFTSGKRCTEPHPEVDNELRAEIVRIFGKWTRSDWEHLHHKRTFPGMASADARMLQRLVLSPRKAS